jgi:acetyl coenzyme A synthetase (ADP forming)-like protein
MVSFVKALSQETLSLRFNRQAPDPEPLVEWLLPVPDRFSLLAWHDEKVVGHAAYHISSKDTAEASVVIADEFEGKGVGTLLLGQLTEAASDAGITKLDYEVLPENHSMLQTLHDLGFPLKQEIEPGLVHISHPTDLSPDAVRQFDLREAVASANAVRMFLKPRSVAVIGAARERGTIGGELFHNCIEAGFNGPVYPVNPTADAVQSVVAYKSVLDCPGPVDLAVICVRAEFVVNVAEECARKGVKSLVVISAGFAEAGGMGTQVQSKLIDICRASGMRLVGPNCVGIANTAPDVHLNAQFSHFAPHPGKLGVLSQSGGVGLSLIDYANREGHGISSFVSVGNKADISANDLLEYWENDVNTDVILLYIESFGNPRKFSRIARRIARKKPIIVVKGGRSSAGFRATQSHTGALIAASDVTVGALFRQAGVIRVDNLEVMFDVASLIANQPAPSGDRIAIITNAGGAGILAADACEDLGLTVPELSPATAAALRSYLRADASVRNPVDMVASATADNYARTLKVVADEPGISAIVVIFLPPLTLTAQEVGQSIMKSARDINGKVPIIAVMMASEDMPPVLSDGVVNIPSFSFPEEAMQAVAKAVHYGSWLATPEEPAYTYTAARKVEAAALVAKALDKGGDWLSPEDVEALLECYGIPMVKTLVLPTPEAAGKAANDMGGNVVLKAVAPGVLHKKDAGAVILNLKGADAVQKAATDLKNQLASKGFTVTGFVLQPQLDGAVEMLVGVTHDVTFGPVIVCGAGGTLVELVKDVSVRLTPLTVKDADEMVHSLRTFPLLTGYRGSVPCDVGALKEVVLRIACLSEDLHEVIELDLNPLMVLPDGKGAFVVDARVRVGPPPLEIPLGAKKR